MAAKDLRMFVQSISQRATRGNRPGVDSDVVYRMDSGFVCGRCHEMYAGFPQAFECLQKCTLQGRLRSAVQRQPSLKGDRFVCSFCSRSHIYKSDALRCSENCLISLKNKADLPPRLLSALQDLQDRGENAGFKRTRGPLFRAQNAPGVALPPVSAPVAAPQVSEQVDWPYETAPEREESFQTAPPRAPTRVLQEDLLLQEVTPSVALSNAEEINIDSLDFDSGALEVDESALSSGIGFEVEHSTAPAEEISMGIGDTDFGQSSSSASNDSDSGSAEALGFGGEISNVSASPEAPVPELKRDKNGEVLMRKPHMKPFKRADAKYVCTVCSEKYFTKGDVDACFLSHPLDDMV